MPGYDNHSHLIRGLSVTSIAPSWHKVNLVRVILDDEWAQSIVPLFIVCRWRCFSPCFGKKRLVFFRISPGQHEHCRRVAEALELL